MTEGTEGTARALALTMGEPSGVGGEIACKAWLRRGTPPFFVIDEPGRLARLARQIGIEVPVRAIGGPEEADAAFAHALPVLPLELPGEVIPGRPNPENAKAVIAAIDRAVELVTAARARAVVTNPIHKKSLYEAGFKHPGHTEYLAAKAGTTAVMMLAVPGLRVVPVTVHLPLAEAVAALDRASIVAKARVTAAALKRDFGIARPRLGVAALNPHAGEEGRMGSEEALIIAPAVAELRRMGIDATGPEPADTMFRESARADFDAILCMYHDQALIPLKTIDFEHGVNITLGLPFVRTSPDHGTALDLAGSGGASESSLVAALKTAAEMAQRRTAARRSVA